MSKVLSNAEKTEWLVFCPACKMGHMFRTPPWEFNGNRDRPTFRASMMVRYTKMLPKGEEMLERGEYPPQGESFPHKDMVCHSLVTDGMIQFLGDCTHEMRGQTVELPDFEGK